jgi:hypothetical protein
MKPVNLLLLGFFAVGLFAQEHKLTAFSNGVEVEFLAKVEPDGGVSLPGAVAVEKDGTVHRQISDRQNRRQFGYNLRVEPLPDPQTVRVRIAPLTLFGTLDGWTSIALAKYPDLPVVRIGETVAFDLLANPATGQKIVEYLTLRRSEFERLRASGSPTDFTLADVNFTLDEPRVWTNGKLEEATVDNSYGVSAHILWLYLPEGAFEISVPPETSQGFRKAGLVAGKTLVFREGSNEYRVESETPIVPGEGLYNVYILRDPDWGPGPGKDGFALGGADHPRQLSITPPKR